MTLPAAQSRTVFRACVVTAVREGEGLMEQLVSHTLDEISKVEAETRAIAKRDLASEALALLRKHKAALIKGYPMALLEVFADGPEAKAAKPLQSAGIDFGELSLVDDDEVQAQVELSRAQQVALHKTEEVLAELNGLVSAAQGLARVQPERNPLRPENYIRALQRVVAETQVVTPVREAWMQHMRTFLGEQLIGVYTRANQGLRKHGIEQVGWRSQSGAPMGYLRSDFMAGVSGPPTGYGGYGPTSGYGGPGDGGVGRVSHWQVPTGPVATMGGPLMAHHVEEDLLTVNILRQMLAGGGDPYQQAYAPASQMSRGVVSQRASAESALSAGGQVLRYSGSVGTEALEDIAQLERLVGRLASSNQSGFQQSAQAGMRSGQASLYGSAEPTPMGAEVVARMVENISRDSRLLPPIQKAVQDMEPAIRKLIRHDARFFSDAHHPARRLLDDLTQRSLAYTHVEAPGFSRFMRLVDQAVAHLSKTEIVNAAPFETVRRALHAAWDAQEKKQQARQEREKRALLLAEAREMRAERVAEEVGAMGLLVGAPQDVADFVLGPWVEVVAGYEPDEHGDLGSDARAALELVPLILWSVQPELTRHDTDRLDEAAALLPARLRSELERAGHPAADTDAFLLRLEQLHRDGLLAAPPDIHLPDSISAPLDGEASDVEGIEGAFDDSAMLYDPDTHHDGLGDAPLSSDEAATELADVRVEGAVSGTPADTPSADDLFKIGAWVELRSSGKWMRTQLTWFSPHNTLFLFTAPDGSTQSMTRRMRDKLLAQDGLRFLDTRPVVARAIDDLAESARSVKRS